MNDLDPQISAELEALEAALNGEPGADPVLLALVEDVRATATPMPLALKTRLEARAAAGFPREQRRRFTLPRFQLLPTLGVAATLIVALVVGTAALNSRGGDSNDGALTPLSAQTSDSTSEKSAAASGAAGGSGSVAGTVAPATPQADQLATPSAAAPSSSTTPDAARGFARKVERGVQLTLRVGGGQLEDTADGVVRTTQQLGGYVSTSQVSARGSGGSADFTLRIPTAKLDQAIAQLSKLGHVARLDQSSQDITGAFVSVADQLKDARAERKALLRALGKATTASQISALKQRIAINRSTIAAEKGRLDGLRRRADLATVQLSVVASGKANVVAPGKGDDSWSPGDAAKDAVRVLEVIAGGALVALAVLIPLALLLALLGLAARTTRRHRREHALDAA